MKHIRQGLIVTAIIVLGFAMGRSDAQSHETNANALDYKNPLLPIEQRVQDLLSKMTLKEKVGQMNIPTCYSTELGNGLGYKGGYLWDDPSKANRDKQLGLQEMGPRDSQ